MKEKILFLLVLLVSIGGYFFSTRAIELTPEELFMFSGGEEEVFGRSYFRTWQGGTGTSTQPTQGQILVGNSAGKYDLLATSSLGIISSETDPIWSATSSNYLPLYGGTLTGAFSSPISTTLGTTTANGKTTYLNNYGTYSIVVGDGTLTEASMAFITNNNTDIGTYFLLNDGTTERGYVKMDNNEDLILKGDEISFDTGSNNVFRVNSAGAISVGTWNGTAIDFSTYTNATGGNAITITGGDAINFDGGSSPAGSLGGTWANPTVDSDGTWTEHNSYPTGCTAGQYVSAVGDTLTCSTPAGGGGGATDQLGQIGDVATTTLADGYSLGYVGTGWESTSTLIMIDEKVGIGTTTPEAKLVVEGDNVSTSTIQIGSSGRVMCMAVGTTGGNIKYVTHNGTDWVFSDTDCSQ